LTDEALREELKEYLKITWIDADTESNLLKIIKRGKSYLETVAGSTIDYETDLTAKQLLLDYGRYVYNHSFELFQINFISELVALSIREGVKSYEETDSETTT
jgi:hypothetical protein